MEYPVEREFEWADADHRMTLVLYRGQSPMVWVISSAGFPVEELRVRGCARKLARRGRAFILSREEAMGLLDGTVALEFSYLLGQGDWKEV